MYRIRCTHKEETKEERCYSEKGLQCTGPGAHTKKRQRKKDVTLTRILQCTGSGAHTKKRQRKKDVTLRRVYNVQDQVYTQRRDKGRKMLL